MYDISKIKEEYPFESNFLEIGPYKYHYVDEGSGSPLVMVHGNPTWSFYFRKLICEFRKSNRVIAPDHLGCGLSDKPQDYHYRLETHIDNFEHLMFKLKLENITLVLHDWGGAIGMGFATRNPDKIKQLIILNSAAFSIKRFPLRIAICRLPWIGEIMIRKWNLFCYFATKMATYKKLSKTAKEGLLLPYDSFENRVAINQFVKDIPSSPDDSSYESLLEIEHALWMFRELKICLIWGMKDWCFNRAFLKQWQRFFPQAEIHKIRKTGHYLLEDSPEKVIEHMKGFLCN